MKQVLTQPKNALIKQYQELFRMDGVELHFTDGALEEVAKLAISRKTGARGLRAMLDPLLMDAMFILPERKYLNAVYVDSSAIRGERKPLFLTGNVTLEWFLQNVSEEEGSSIDHVDGVEEVSVAV